jgi:hypothetical protein
MSLFSVNYRGVGNASTVRELRDFVVKFAPSILCIQEAQIDRGHVESLAGLLGFDKAFAIDSAERSGGLGIFWSNDISIDILGYSQYHIDISIVGIGDIPWRLMSVYGEAQISERHRTWDMLKDVCSSSSLPWLCLGNFNEVLHPDEHDGIGQRTLSEMQGFRDAVDFCNLINMGFKGHFWMWEKRVTGGTYTRVCLDRALGSAEWSAQFPLACITHVDMATSDHSALSVRLMEDPPCFDGRQFCYEAMWELHDDLKPTIANGWTATPGKAADGLLIRLKRIYNF